MIELLKTLLGAAFTEEISLQVKEFLASEYVLKSQALAMAGEEADPSLREAMRAELKAELETEIRTEIRAEIATKIEAEIRTEIEAAYSEKLEVLRFDYALSIALLNAKVIDVDLVKVKLDLANLSLAATGEIIGLDEQIAGVKSKFPMLFLPESDKQGLQEIVLSGFKPVVSELNVAKITKSDFKKMNYQERLSLMESNPGLYNSFM